VYQLDQSLCERDGILYGANIVIRKRSPLKWAGGKYQILDRICAQLPAGKRLLEPFLGSGVVALNTEFDHYLLNDVNQDLVCFYQAIQADVQKFMATSRRYFCNESNQEDRYYQLRDKFNRSRSSAVRAALFLYLNKHGYNGLCRYNSKGEFNVPFGRYKRVLFPEHALVELATFSQGAIYLSEDFETFMMRAEPGDVIYCDPPYAPLSSTANFTGYSSTKFDEQDQKRLVRTAELLSARGIPVLISNHDTGFVRELYGQAMQMDYFKVRRAISCQGRNRRPVKEVLAVFAK
jgi:DNA adenine methylase